MSNDEKLTGKENVAEAAKPAKKSQKSKKKGTTQGASRIVTWFKEVKAEAFKIIWPNRTELTKMTFTVIVTSLLFGALIAGMDMVFRFGVDFLISAL